MRCLNLQLCNGHALTIFSLSLLQLKYLKDELVGAFRRSNCVSQVCTAFENGSRQEMFKQGSKALETLPSNLCTVLNFSAAECVTLAYCLTQSQYRIFAGDSFRILKIKCPEVNNFESVANIHPDVLTAIGQYVYSSEVCKCNQVKCFYAQY